MQFFPFSSNPDFSLSISNSATFQVFQTLHTLTQASAPTWLMWSMPPKQNTGGRRCSSKLHNFSTSLKLRAFKTTGQGAPEALVSKMWR